MFSCCHACVCVCAGADVTCVLLRAHGSVEDYIEMVHPFLLIRIRFTGEQEAALRGFYGDAVLPRPVIVGSRGQSDRNAVPVIPVSQKHLAFSERVLTDTEETQFIFDRFQSSFLS